MSAFADAIAAGLGSVRDVAGVSIIYARGSNQISLTAVPARSLLQSTDVESLVQVQFTTRDYVIVAAELVIDSELTLPRKGDRITETIGGQNKTFEVLKTDGDRFFSYCDDARSRIRVHTKETVA